MGKLLNVTEFAMAIGLKPATVRQWVWRREVEFVRIGRSIRFKPETAQKIIAEGTIPALGEESTRSRPAKPRAASQHWRSTEGMSEPWDDVDLPPECMEDDALPSDVTRLSQPRERKAAAKKH